MVPYKLFLLVTFGVQIQVHSQKIDFDRIFHAPKPNYDDMEILERSNFEPDDSKMASKVSTCNKDEPKAIANAQVLLNFPNRADVGHQHKTKRQLPVIESRNFGESQMFCQNQPKYYYPFPVFYPGPISQNGPCMYPKDFYYPYSLYYGSQYPSMIKPTTILPQQPITTPLMSCQNQPDITSTYPTQFMTSTLSEIPTTVTPTALNPCQIYEDLLAIIEKMAKCLLQPNQSRCDINFDDDEKLKIAEALNIIIKYLNAKCRRRDTDLGVLDRDKPIDLPADVSLILEDILSMLPITLLQVRHGKLVVLNQLDCLLNIVRYIRETYGYMHGLCEIYKDMRNVFDPCIFVKDSSSDNYLSKANLRGYLLMDSLNLALYLVHKNKISELCPKRGNEIIDLWVDYLYKSQFLDCHESHRAKTPIVPNIRKTEQLLMKLRKLFLYVYASGLKAKKSDIEGLDDILEFCNTKPVTFPPITQEEYPCVKEKHQNALYELEKDNKLSLEELLSLVENYLKHKYNLAITKEGTKCPKPSTDKNSCTPIDIGEVGCTCSTTINNKDVCMPSSPNLNDSSSPISCTTLPTSAGVDLLYWPRCTTEIGDTNRIDTVTPDFEQATEDCHLLAHIDPINMGPVHPIDSQSHWEDTGGSCHGTGETERPIDAINFGQVEPIHHEDSTELYETNGTDLPCFVPKPIDHEPIRPDHPIEPIHFGPVHPIEVPHTKGPCPEPIYQAPDHPITLKPINFGPIHPIEVPHTKQHCLKPIYQGPIKPDHPVTLKPINFGPIHPIEIPHTKQPCLKPIYQDPIKPDHPVTVKPINFGPIHHIEVPHTNEPCLELNQTSATSEPINLGPVKPHYKNPTEIIYPDDIQRECTTSEDLSYSIEPINMGQVQPIYAHHHLEHPHAEVCTEKHSLKPSFDPINFGAVEPTYPHEEVNPTEVCTEMHHHSVPHIVPIHFGPVRPINPQPTTGVEYVEHTKEPCPGDVINMGQVNPIHIGHPKEPNVVKPVDYTERAIVPINMGPVEPIYLSESEKTCAETQKERQISIEHFKLGPVEPIYISHPREPVTEEAQPKCPREPINFGAVEPIYHKPEHLKPIQDLKDEQPVCTGADYLIPVEPVNLGPVRPIQHPENTGNCVTEKTEAHAKDCCTQTLDENGILADRCTLGPSVKKPVVTDDKKIVDMKPCIVQNDATQPCDKEEILNLKPAQIDQHVVDVNPCDMDWWPDRCNSAPSVKKPAAIDEETIVEVKPCKVHFDEKVCDKDAPSTKPEEDPTSGHTSKPNQPICNPQCTKLEKIPESFLRKPESIDVIPIKLPCNEPIQLLCPNYLKHLLTGNNQFILVPKGLSQCEEPKSQDEFSSNMLYPGMSGSAYNILQSPEPIPCLTCCNTGCAKTKTDLDGLNPKITEQNNSVSSPEDGAGVCRACQSCLNGRRCPQCTAYVGELNY